MSRLPTLVSVALALSATTACVGHQPVPGRAVTALDVPYPKVHRDWTEELKLYDSLETRLLMRATLKSAPFRRAYAAELARRSAMSEGEYQELLASELAEAKDAWTVVFANMRTDSRSRSFGEEEDDAWQLSLTVDGQACTFRSAERQIRPNATLTAMYPQHNGWSDLWIATFEADCGTGREATLAVTGALGSGKLTWDLAGG